MATKEFVAVYVGSADVWKKYIARVNESYVTKVQKAPKTFPALVLERLTEGWCSTDEALIVTSQSGFKTYANALTDYHLKDAVKRWNLDGKSPSNDKDYDDDDYNDLPF